MNHSLDDRLRSVARFVAVAMGSPPWTVHTERSEVTDDQRPVALVETATPTGATSLLPRISIEQGMVQRQQTLSVTLFPEFKVAGVVVATSEVHRLANIAATKLERCIAHGMVPEVGDPATTWPWATPPERLPVFDFEGVPTVGAAAARKGPDAPYAWMWVEDYSFRPIQDPQDTRRWSVVGTVRVSWEQAGRRRPAGVIAGSMPGTFVPPVPAP